MISPEQAAEAIAKGLQKRLIHFPVLTLMMKALRLLPTWLYFKIGRCIH